MAQEDHKRGIRGAYFLRARLELVPRESHGCQRFNADFTNGRREFTGRCQFRYLDVHGQWQELAELSAELFRRSGCIRQLSLAFPQEALLGD